MIVWVLVAILMIALAITGTAIRVQRRTRLIPDAIVRRLYELRTVAELARATTKPQKPVVIYDPRDYDLTGLVYRSCRCRSKTCPHWHQVRPADEDIVATNIPRVATQDVPPVLNTRKCRAVPYGS